MSLTVPRTLRCALLALALMAAGPVAGAAAAPSLPVPAPSSAIGAASDLAASHWGSEACGGAVAVTWEHLGRGVNAESRWSNPAGGGPGTYFNCTIAYSLDVRWDWPKLCTITEHELGHLTGHAHADDPGDLMAPYYAGPSDECAAAKAPAGLAAAKAATPKKAAAKARSRTRTARDRNKSAR